MKMIIRKTGRDSKGIRFVVEYLHPDLVENGRRFNEHKIYMGPWYSPAYDSGSWHVNNGNGYKSKLYHAMDEQAWNNLAGRVLAFNQEHSNNKLTVDDVVWEAENGNGD